MDVLVICAPVFATLGLGKLLGARGLIRDSHCGFINWLVYTICLPALIFSEVARQRFDLFIDPTVVAMPLLGLLVVVALTAVISKFKGYSGGFAASFTYGTYWANATYIGLPICRNAFGSEGLAKAAIYNGFVVPCFILFSYALIGVHGAGTGDQRVGARIKKALFNPILLSALAGVAVAALAESFRGERGALGPLTTASATLVGSFLGMIGSMGLPLALLSIGASLRWEGAKSHWGALSWVVGCKLVLLPLVTLWLIRALCPDAGEVALGVAVILSGAPSAVAMYVISCQVGVERGFVSSMLVLSTVLSVITIPIWIYVIKGL